MTRITVDDIDRQQDRVIVSKRSGNTESRQHPEASITPSRTSDNTLSVTNTELQALRSIHTTDGRTRVSRTRSNRDKTLNITPTTINNATRAGGSSGISRNRGRGSRVAIDVGANNTVVVKGRPTRSHLRPYLPRHLDYNIGQLYHSPRWRSHSGLYFSFIWSGNSCGRLVYLPYTYYSSWCYPAYYHEPCYGLSYYYPGYHRKFVFVSIGGYWPDYYRYRRYYWYGCHPYYWYGATIITEPTQYVTYNIYNNNNDDYGSGFSSSPTPYYTLGEPKEQVVDEPQYQSPTDLCFDHGVKLFAAGNYEDAVKQFREAVTLSPDDIILPFTYSQALFANGDYAMAASVLREAMGNIPDDELTIYYPRGLYTDDDVLEGQIKQLEKAIILEPFGSDYQLLLGYQQLGMGDLKKARCPLQIAAQNPANKKTALKLLELADRLEAQANQSE